VTTDSEFVNAPKFTFSPGAEYSVALRSAGQLVGRVDYIYKSRIQYDYGNSPLIAQDPYGLFECQAHLAATPESSTVSCFFGTNLTNAHYAVGGIDDSPTGSLGEVVKLMGPPRTWVWVRNTGSSRRLGQALSR
jgi:hypothetical protein